MSTEYRYLCGVSLSGGRWGGHQCPRHYQRMAGLLRSHRWLLWTGNIPLHENTLRLSTEYCLETAHPHRFDDAIIRKAAFVVGDRLETDVRSMSCGTETSNLMKCSEGHLFPQSHFSVIWYKLLHGFRSKAAIIAHLLTGVRIGRRRHSAILFLPQVDSVPVNETHQHLDDAGLEKVTHTPVGSSSLTIIGTDVSAQVTVILVCVFHDISIKTEPCYALSVLNTSHNAPFGCYVWR